MRVCRSPWLIAAYHGLHRLRVPRHSPHAFVRLTTQLLVPRVGALAPPLGILHFSSPEWFLASGAFAPSFGMLVIQSHVASRLRAIF